MKETDPNGIDIHAPGAKVDNGKIRVGLMFKGFPRALLKVAEVVTFGAEKYSPLGFLDVPDAINRYDDAKGRHILKGYIEDKDSDSDLTHMAHEAWNALAKLEIRLREEEQDQLLQEEADMLVANYFDTQLAELQEKADLDRLMNLSIEKDTQLKNLETQLSDFLKEKFSDITDDEDEDNSCYRSWRRSDDTCD